jgi:mono/diheme cytochrome c family protein
MNALMEQEIAMPASPARAQQRRSEAAAAPAAAPRKIWGVLMVGGAVCFGVVTLLMAPALNDWLVATHSSRPAAAAASPAGALAKVDPAAKLRGQVLFIQGCNACHGDDARGRVGLGKDLVHSAFVKSQSAPQLVTFLKKGRDISDPLNTTRVPMPPKGGNPALNDKQLNDLVAYVRGIQQ